MAIEEWWTLKKVSKGFYRLGSVSWPCLATLFIHCKRADCLMSYIAKSHFSQSIKKPAGKKKVYPIFLYNIMVTFF